MKAIIDGLVYDTASAEELGEASYGYAGDFSAWHATLYRTPSGRHFLAGEGGPMTRWAEHHSDGSRSGSRGIQALEPDEARCWAENHLAPEEYLSAWPNTASA